MPQAMTRPMRDVERIERICAPLRAHIRLVLRTMSLCRTVHRDFNIVTAKMFFARGAKVKALAGALRELERACVQAELAARPWRADYGVDFPAQNFELRIVSAFASRYARSIARLDALQQLLVAAETRGRIDRRIRNRTVRPCFALLREIKHIALDLPAPEGASQISVYDPRLGRRIGRGLTLMK